MRDGDGYVASMLLSQSAVLMLEACQVSGMKQCFFGNGAGLRLAYDGGVVDRWNDVDDVARSPAGGFCMRDYSQTLASHVFSDATSLVSERGPQHLSGFSNAPSRFSNVPVFRANSSVSGARFTQCFRRDSNASVINTASATLAQRAITAAGPVLTANHDIAPSWCT